MKYVLSILCSVLLLQVHAQIGPPGLSIGANEVLFEKGVIDVELLGEIISEKQDELKQELAKRLILNKHLSAGPYVTYDYARKVLEAVLDHKDKSLMKKQLLESSTELAVLLGITEAYLKIDWRTTEKLIVDYSAFLANNGVQRASEEVDNYVRITRENEINQVAISKGKFLTKISELYKLKNLGKYTATNGFSTYLQYILLDMVMDICRKNPSLQQLGFFQKKFDNVAFTQRSHYNRFLEVSQDDELNQTLRNMYDKADKTITINLKYASIILDQPYDRDTTSMETDAFMRSIRLLSKDVYDKVVGLDFDLSTGDDREIISELTLLCQVSGSLSKLFRIAAW